MAHMNLSAPYPFKQPLGRDAARNLAHAHRTGTLFGAGLGHAVANLRRTLAETRRSLTRDAAKLTDPDEREEYTVALLRDAARLSSQLTICEAGVDLVLADAKATGVTTRCRRCHHAAPVGAVQLDDGAYHQIVLAHAAGSMRCSGSAEIIRAERSE